MSRPIAGSPAIVTLTILTLMAILAWPPQSRAEIQYPWCAQYRDGNDGPGGTNCGFVTIGQCRATISGIGGICYENPFYRTAAPRFKKSHKR